MKKPNFFIVGAPKCGTTAMYEYLYAHPDIFMPKLKEFDYFSRDLHFRYPRMTLSQYLDHFSKAQNEKRVGEVELWSIFSQSSAKEIKAFSPDAKIMIMLRNPVDMIYSLHSQNLQNGHEDIADFERALEAESERKQGKNVPKTIGLLEAIYYRDLARFSPHVQRYYETFGEQQVLVLLLEDLRRSPAEVYRNTLEFLEVSPDFQPDFRVVNANRVVRNPGFAKLLHSLPAPVIRLAQVLIPRASRHAMYRKVVDWNSKEMSRTPMAPQLRARLMSEFAPDIERLGKLLQRDLSVWSES